MHQQIKGWVYLSDTEHQTLMVQVAKEHRSWGYDRIASTLAHPEYEITEVWTLGRLVTYYVLSFTHLGTRQVHIRIRIRAGRATRVWRGTRTVFRASRLPTTARPFQQYSPGAAVTADNRRGTRRGE
jgi:hypothetical protein